MKKLFIYLLLLCNVPVLFSQQNNDPYASVAGKHDGTISIDELLSASKVESSQTDVQIVFFSVSYAASEDDIVEIISKSDQITPEMKELFAKLTPGKEINFENIKAKRGDKTVILESLVLKITQ